MTQTFDVDGAMLSTAFVILGAESIGLLDVHQKLNPPHQGLDTTGYDTTVQWFADWGTVIQREYELQTALGFTPDDVFDYQVSEAFGQWAAEEALAVGKLPEHKDAHAHLISLIEGVMVK